MTWESRNADPSKVKNRARIKTEKQKEKVEDDLVLMLERTHLEV